MSASVLLPASILALGSGPLVSRLAGKRPSVMAFLDGFIMVAIGGLVLLEVVPHALQDGHYASLLFMVMGFVLPTVAERLLHLGVRQTHLAVLLLALAGLVVHSLLDGSALANASRSSTSLLGVGVVLHQLPVSLMIWWGFRDRPRWVSWLALSLMALFTIAGFFAEPSVFAAMPHSGAAWFEALVGGSLLHVVAHPAHDHAHEHEDAHEHAHDGGHSHGHHGHDHHHDDAHDHAHDHAHGHTHDHAIAYTHVQTDTSGSNGLGAVAGLLLLVALLLTRGVAAADSPFSPLQEVFLALLLRSAPVLLLACAVAGLAHAFLPPTSLRWLNRGTRVHQATAGTLVGVPLPVCSCGVVPLYQQMVQQGVSPTAALAFLIATPTLGIDAVLLSVPLLGAPFTVVWVTAAIVTAVVLALAVGAAVPALRRGLPLAMAQPDAQGPGARFVQAMRTGFGHVVDDTAPWILVGLVVAALLAPALGDSWLTRLPFGVDVLVFAAIGFPIYLWASAATPLVSVLVAAGVSPGAGLALLLTGPATNVATVSVVARLHGRRTAIILCVTIVALALLLGVGLNVVWPTVAGLQPVLPPASHAPWWQWGAVVVLVLLYLMSLLRRGARGFLEELRLNVED